MLSRGVRDRSTPGLLASKADAANAQSVEEAEREKPRRARGSDDVAGIHEWSGLGQRRKRNQRYTALMSTDPNMTGNPNLKNCQNEMG